MLMRSLRYFASAVIILAILSFDISFSIDPIPMKCPEINVKNPSPAFKPERLSGLWYPVKGFTNRKQCWNTTFQINQTHVTSENHYYIIRGGHNGNGTRLPIRTGRNYTVSEWTFPLKMDLANDANKTTWILDSDFDGYIALYKCFQFSPHHSPLMFLHVYSRKPVLSEAEFDKACDAYVKFNLGSEAVMNLNDYKRGDKC